MRHLEKQSQTGQPWENCRRGQHPKQHFIFSNYSIRREIITKILLLSRLKKEKIQRPYQREFKREPTAFGDFT